jgi:hypothetical protein
MQKAISYVLRYLSSLIIFAMKKNCVGSGKSVLSYLFTGRVIHLTVVIVEAYRCLQASTKLKQNRNRKIIRRMWRS